MKRSQRLQSAKIWLPEKIDKKIVKAYRKRYGVDWPTAFKELEMLGVEIDPIYKEQVLNTIQKQAEIKRCKRLERAAQDEQELGHDQDERFAFIVGYTSGGAAYGLTWEEWDEIEASEEIG